MSYSTLSTDTFNKHIAELARLSNTLPGVVIIHKLDGSVVWMSERGLALLGITQEEATQLSSAEYYNKFFNGEDAKDYVPKILTMLEHNNDDEFCTYFQQVRYKGQADYTWHMSSVKIWMRDAAGAPLYTITMAFPVEAMHHMKAKAERLLQENNFLRQNINKYASLSQRERDILKYMAEGKSSGDTAAELFISFNTVETHRKNIKRKLGTNSFYELSQYARAFDLI
ncbi:response regulator transcription factor [Mucilaginibacter terrae]|uniref:DNA-binding CsgD family transcriptional regulator n=1 Tax=Mucilaginibacter terrae TaxID=1955052 RepID=A0ABU3GWA9_9SPHI|nr:helix-turn-helix transcriptional regulator [Mucilaginibacter terrae]MDT3404049.1 DNA-binding CsgD family transcriptional regulator [Mucilaginibacter terrae]